VECLPGDIPERIDVDVSELGINESLRVSDIQFPAKVKVLEAPDQVVVHVVAVKEEVAPAAAAAAPVAEGEAAASSTEPEVIKKGKKEEEEPKAE
jgi:large subunit ribosomal protein L25